MLSIQIGYPNRDEEREIVKATTRGAIAEVAHVLTARDIVWVQQLVRQIPATDHMIDYAVDLARATRPDEDSSPEFVKNWLAWGAGPRAAQYLILGAKARALLHGRLAVHADDVRALAHPVLRHRIFTNFNADAEGIDTKVIIDKLLETVPEAAYGERALRPRNVADRSGEVPPDAVEASPEVPQTARPVVPPPLRAPGPPGSGAGG
jgi:MoxR-like ATPase